MPKFQFTPDQIENLKNSKLNLNMEEAKNWYSNEEKAEIQTTAILNNEKFIQGENLSAEKLDDLFKNMRWFSANRNLTNLLYRSDIDEFNNKLRNLLHGTASFPERINDFLKMKGIGIQTLSQFLVASDTKKHAFISSQLKEVLTISSEQDQDARMEALEIHQINNPENYLERTLEYLRDCVIFKSVKDLLSLEKYTLVNNLLWFTFEREDEDPEEIIKSYGSISIENDLKSFLADNIFLVEKGLTLKQKEYDTREVGRIDLLCKDQKNNHVVIELKKGRKNDEVVGQILRYLGWVEKNLKTKVRGIIIVNEPDERLEYALYPIKNLIELKFYKVNFEIKDKV